MIKLLFFYFALMAWGNVFSNVSYGKKLYSQETIERIEMSGCVKLQGTKISDFLQVNGNLQAFNAKIQSMQINGSAELNECEIYSKSAICGFLISKKSKFNRELSVSSEHVIFESSHIESLRITPVAKFLGIQTVYLKDESKINGDVFFESGSGQVILDDQSQINGAVIGGSIKKHKPLANH